jgi:predicted DNA binding protein
MWVANFKVWHKGSLFIALWEKYKLHAYSRYLNTYKENKVPKIMREAVFWGENSSKAVDFIRLWPSSKIIYSEKNRVIFSTNAIKSFHSTVLSSEVFLMNPILEEYGWQLWTLGSSNKENLIKFYEKIGEMKEMAKIELIDIRKATLEEFSLISKPTINFRDIEWWQKAMQEGYYEYPRKISLEDLAKKLNVPFSTLKDHLRKTERSLMKEMSKKYANPLYSESLLNKETNNS